MRLYDPEAPLISAFRSLEDYANENLPAVYDVQMSFPDTTLIQKSLPLKKTIIHFEFDNVINRALGFGPNVVDYTYDEDEEVVTQSEASWHEHDIDVGIWASADSGGTTARMEAYQDLLTIFHGAEAEERCTVETDGIQIDGFEGGMFFVDSINDLPIWRVRDITLKILVASKKVYAPVPYIQTIDQTPGIYIEDTVLVTD